MPNYRDRDGWSDSLPIAGPSGLASVGRSRSPPSDRPSSGGWFVVNEPAECSRRAFLAGIGTGTALSFAGGAGSAAADLGQFDGIGGIHSSSSTSGRRSAYPNDRYAQRVSPTFDVTLDAVSDLGCDPSGNRPSDRALDAGLAAVDASRVRVRFPPGTYRFDSTNQFRGYDALGFVGAGGMDVTSETDETSTPNGTQFVCPANFQREWFRTERVGAFVFRGIDWDIRAPGCGPSVVPHVERSLLIEDVRVRGRGEGDANLLMPRVASPEGVGVLRRFEARAGGLIGRRRIGVWIGPANRGTLRFEACRLEEFPNNGLYASASRGAIQVSGGVYRNSDISQLRLSGRNCYVRGTLVEVDVRDYDGPGSSQYRNPRGIWWEAKRRNATGGRVEYTTIRIRRGPSVGGCVIAKSGGALTISRTAIDVDATDTHGIYAYEPTGGYHEVPPRPWRVRLERVHVYGASDAPAIQIEGRPESSVSRSCIANGMVVADRPAEDTLDQVTNLARDGRRLVGARTGCFDDGIGADAAPSIPPPAPPARGDVTAPLEPIAVHTALLVGVLGVACLLSVGAIVTVGSTLRSLFDAVQ